MMSKHSFNVRQFLTLATTLVATVASRGDASAQIDPRYPQHDTLRPQPVAVRPAVASSAERVGRAPSDAVVLYDGHDLSKWTSGDGRPALWTSRDGYMEVTKGKGGIETRETFGDAQVHVEWMSPSPAEGSGQDRGNSGVFLMRTYEVQVLDSYGNRTYPDGQAASIYGQVPPLVNASLPPGQWQTYDIIFRRPRFNADGSVQSPAIMTVFHNGVLVQDHIKLVGPTSNGERAPYVNHADRLPISLQDHGHPVRFRNIWVRDLEKQ
jgi:hypothetical protein